MPLPTALKVYLGVAFFLALAFYTEMTSAEDPDEKHIAAILVSFLLALTWPLWITFLPFRLIDMYKRS